jgi:hypothetical protein
MTKLDAEPLDYDEFCKASIEKRNEIRQAFKEALTYRSCANIEPEIAKHRSELFGTAG